MVMLLVLRVCGVCVSESGAFVGARRPTCRPWHRVRDSFVPSSPLMFPLPVAAANQTNDSRADHDGTHLGYLQDGQDHITAPFRTRWSGNRELCRMVSQLSCGCSVDGLNTIQLIHVVHGTCMVA